MAQLADIPVIAVVRDEDGEPVGVYTDPSEARVRLIYIEEETKKPHTLIKGYLVLFPEMKERHEVAHDYASCPSFGDAR